VNRYNFGCMAAINSLFDSRWVFGVKLSEDDIAEIEGLRYVATATSFGTKIDITCFVTGSIARSANLPVFNLLRGRF